MCAMSIHAFELSVDFSQSLANLRQRFSQVKVRVLCLRSTCIFQLDDHIIEPQNCGNSISETGPIWSSRYIGALGWLPNWPFRPATAVGVDKCRRCRRIKFLKPQYLSPCGQDNRLSKPGRAGGQYPVPRPAELRGPAFQSLGRRRARVFIVNDDMSVFQTMHQPDAGQLPCIITGRDRAGSMSARGREMCIVGLRLAQAQVPPALRRRRFNP